MKREVAEIPSVKVHWSVVSTVHTLTTWQLISWDLQLSSGHCGAFQGQSDLLKALLRCLLCPHVGSVVAETVKSAICPLGAPMHAFTDAAV